MECGHGGICYDCSLEVWKTTGECYLCRDVNNIIFLNITYYLFIIT